MCSARPTPRTPAWYRIHEFHTFHIFHIFHKFHTTHGHKRLNKIKGKRINVNYKPVSYSLQFRHRPQTNPRTLDEYTSRQYWSANFILISG